MNRAKLRLVEAPNEPAQAEVIALDAKTEKLANARDLRAEAEAITARFGENLYSKFLVKHGRRPDPAQAAIIGRLIGARVKASDGSMQPRQTTAERDTRREEQRRIRDQAHFKRQVSRLHQAVRYLAKSNSDPAEILQCISATPGDIPIREQIDAAINWLNRFAEEMRRRDANTS